MKKIFLATVLASLTAIALPSFAQSCNVAMKKNKPNAIYTDMGDGGGGVHTVIDEKTGLQWLKCPVGLSGYDCSTGSAQLFTWRDALFETRDQYRQNGLAGKTDWRLPSIAELRTLVEDACMDAAINETFFPKTFYEIGANQDSAYWTSSPYVRDDDIYPDLYSHMAWRINFSSGGQSPFIKTNELRIYLVRNRD